MIFRQKPCEKRGKNGGGGGVRDRKSSIATIPLAWQMNVAVQQLLQSLAASLRLRNPSLVCSHFPVDGLQHS